MQGQQQGRHDTIDIEIKDFTLSAGKYLVNTTKLDHLVNTTKLDHFVSDTKLRYFVNATKVYKHIM